MPRHGTPAGSGSAGYMHGCVAYGNEPRMIARTCRAATHKSADLQLKFTFLA